MRRAACSRLTGFRTVSYDVSKESPKQLNIRQHDTQIAAEDAAQNDASLQASSAEPVDEAAHKPEQPGPKPHKMTVAEQDAALMESWKERQGSLANSEFEGGEVEGGYRRNVKANIFRYI